MLFMLLGCDADSPTRNRATQYLHHMGVEAKCANHGCDAYLCKTSSTQFICLTGGTVQCHEIKNPVEQRPVPAEKPEVR